MRTIKYILVNETSSKNVAHAISDSKLPGIGQCIVVDAGSKFKMQGANDRQKLIERLVRLRNQYPDAKILGVSELGLEVREQGIVSSGHLRPSNAMNQIRMALSDLP